MGYAWIVFSSSTSAGRLKKLALTRQLRGVRMLQTPRAISQNGCTYALFCAMDVLPQLLSLAQQYNIRHGKVYKEHIDEDGKRFFQEIPI
ncbi:MAG: DUF3343 domain-containing protein [Ruminococcaceae bacterium]|nr:DUF3343 domain-containing protein [Oscillospiraceae bacterium]